MPPSAPVSAEKLHTSIQQISPKGRDGSCSVPLGCPVCRLTPVGHRGCLFPRVSLLKTLLMGSHCTPEGVPSPASLHPLQLPPISPSPSPEPSQDSNSHRTAQMVPPDGPLPVLQPHCTYSPTGLMHNAMCQPHLSKCTSDVGICPVI